MFILNGLVPSVGSSVSVKSVRPHLLIEQELDFAAIEFGGYKYLNLEKVGDVLVVDINSVNKHLSNDIATRFSNELRYLAMEEEFSGFSKIVLDFSKIQFMNVNVIEGIVVLRNKLGENLVLCGLSEQASEMLEYTHMNRLVNVRSSREEALKALVA